MSVNNGVVDFQEKNEKTLTVQVHENIKEDYSQSYIWYVISLLAVVNAINYMDRYALSVLLPLIKEDLHLTDGQLGLLVGLAFSVFYAVCGVPIARWADQGNRRSIITLAMVVWSAMTAVSGAAQNFFHLFLARIGVGAGEAGCIPPGQSIISDYVPVEGRPIAHAVHSFGSVIGLMVGMMLAGWLGDIIGWRWAFVALAIPGFLMAVIVRLTLIEPSRGLSDGYQGHIGGDAIPLKEAIGYLRSCRSYVIIVQFFAVNGFLQAALMQWMPSFYERSHILSASEIGFYLGPALGIGSGAGLLLGGALSARLAAKDISLPLKVGAVGVAIALPALIGFLLAPTPDLSFLFAFVAWVFLSVSGGPVVAAVQSVVMPATRATASAIAIFFTSVLGFGLGPFFVGIVSDFIAAYYGVESLRYAMLSTLVLIPFMVILLYRASGTLNADLGEINQIGKQITEYRN